MGQPDYLPTASIDVLRRRAEIVRTIRAFFDDHGFMEVDTPILSHDIVIDRHLHPIPISKAAVTGSAIDQSTSLWLQTSPEFAMKRLLAAGATQIYQIGKAFRQGESGAKHNPEFTMLEWYRVGDDLRSGMQLLDDLVQAILKTPPATRWSYREAFEKFAKIDPLIASDDALHQAAHRLLGQGSDANLDQADRDELLNVILALAVEPHLGNNGCPAIVFDYPASQAALARVRAEEPPVAERFELYINGTELANGYHELLDAEVLMQRNRIANQWRQQDGRPSLPEQSRLLEAMQAGLPGCAGTALGIDRLMMVAIGAQEISEVIPFPLPRA